MKWGAKHLAHFTIYYCHWHQLFILSWPMINLLIISEGWQIGHCISTHFCWSIDLDPFDKNDHILKIFDLYFLQQNDTNIFTNDICLFHNVILSSLVKQSQSKLSCLSNLEKSLSEGFILPLSWSMFLQSFYIAFINPCLKVTRLWKEKRHDFYFIPFTPNGQSLSQLF